MNYSIYMLYNIQYSNFLDSNWIKFSLSDIFTKVYLYIKKNLVLIGRSKTCDAKRNNKVHFEELKKFKKKLITNPTYGYD